MKNDIINNQNSFTNEEIKTTILKPYLTLNTNGSLDVVSEIPIGTYNLTYLASKVTNQSNFSTSVNNNIDIPCNTIDPIPFVSNTFDSLTVTNSTSGLCLIGCGISNPSRLIDSDLNNYTTVSTAIGLGVTHKLRVTDGNTTYVSGTFVGFRIAPNGGLISADLLNNISIKTYLSGVLKETLTGSSLTSVTLLSNPGNYILGFNTNTAFDSFEISISSLAGVITSTNIYYPVITTYCAGPELSCNVPTNLSYPTYPITVQNTHTGVSGISVGSVSNPENVVSASTIDYTSLNLLVGVAGTISLAVKDQVTNYSLGTYVGFEIENSNLASVSSLGNIVLKTYLDGILKEQISGSSLLVNGSLLNSSGRNKIGFVSTTAFDEIQININQTVGVNLGATKVYNAFFQKLCAPSVECNKSYALVNPSFPVIVDGTKSGIDGILCIGCSVNDTNNVLTSSTSDFANISLTAGVLATGSISVVDKLYTYPAGTFAGYAIKDLNALIQLNLFQSLTISTYNNGILQESANGNALIDLSLSNGTIFGSGSGFYNVGFQTTLPFNEIRLSIASLLSLVNNINVYGAIVDTRSSYGTGSGELQCNNTDLSVTKSSSNINPNVGSTITFTIVASNLGPNNASDVIVNDLLPSGYTYVSSIVTFGSYNESTGIWSVGSLSNGAETTLTVTATVNSIGNYINTATITGNQLDINLGNNTATSTPIPNPIEDAPSANDDIVALALTEDGANGTVNILTNDTDPDGNPTTTSGHTVDLDPSTVGNQNSITTPEGTWTYDNTSGIVNFNPADNFNGVATLPYALCDSGTIILCDNANITFTVNPVNDVPVVTNDTTTVAEDTQTIGTILTSTDLDPDGTPLVVTTTPVSGPTNGTIVINPDGTYIYTPNPNFNGTDVVTIQVCDSGLPLPGICENQTLTITVNAVNDIPSVNDDTATTNEDTPVVIDATDNDTDLEGPIDPTSVTITDAPNNGTVTVDPVTGEITYTPNPNFNGTDTFTYQVCDTGLPLPASCDTATVTVTVSAINDAPSANDDIVALALTEDGANGTVNILTNDTDPDGNPTTTSGHTVDLDPSTVGNQNSITTPEGTWTYDNTSGIVNFNPADNFNGVATLPYALCDSGTIILCDNANITFTVNPVNDVPVANNDSETTLSETPITIEVINNPVVSGQDTDIEGNNTIDSTSIDLNPTSPGQQTTLVVPGEGTYTAYPNGTVIFIPFPSTTSFTSIITYTISDNEGAISNIASITIVVGACVSNPNLDCDNDGLTNAEEEIIGTEPTKPDTDGDGVIDGIEVTDGTNPLNTCESVEENVTLEQSLEFLNDDCDNDGLPNKDEIGSDPTNPLDSDGDGIPDYLEFNNHRPSTDDLEIFNLVTPNGDGYNDVFVIRNIELYPDNTVQIYNRWGILVYEVSSYNPSEGRAFVGLSEGRVTISQSSELPSGVYFYVVKYKNSTGNYKERVGYLYINRL